MGGEGDVGQGLPVVGDGVGLQGYDVVDHAEEDCFLVAVGQVLEDELPEGGYGLQAAGRQLGQVFVYGLWFWLGHGGVSPTHNCGCPFALRFPSGRTDGVGASGRTDSLGLGYAMLLVLGNHGSEREIPACAGMTCWGAGTGGGLGGEEE